MKLAEDNEILNLARITDDWQTKSVIRAKMLRSLRKMRGRFDDNLIKPSAGTFLDTIHGLILEQKLSIIRLAKGALWREVIELIKKGAPVDLPNSNEETLTTFAIIEGSLDMLKFCIEHGADVNRDIFEEGLHWSLLTLAIRERKPKMVIFLLNKGADPNYLNDKGENPLILALNSDPPLPASCIRNLVHHGANIFQENNKHETPIGLIAESGNEQLKKIIEEKYNQPFEHIFEFQMSTIEACEEIVPGLLPDDDEN